MKIDRVMLNGLADWIFRRQPVMIMDVREDKH
jgi:hypothetical protein